MSGITVDVSGLSGTITVEVPEGATAADVREAAELNEGLSLRGSGNAIADESDYPVRDGETLVSVAPNPKHG